jgi:glucan 1,4-alpha-glucosidase
MKYLTLIFLFFSLNMVGQNQIFKHNNLALIFSIKDGKAYYSVNYKSKSIINESRLEIVLQGEKSLLSNVELVSIDSSNLDEIWHPILGQNADIQNKYHEYTFQLVQKQTNIYLNIIFRIFDEGISFRYEFPKQSNLNYFVIEEEKTEFNLTGDHNCFWIPADFDSQEYPYLETKISEIDLDKVEMNNGIALKSTFNKFAVQSPFMMKTSDEIYLNIFEAAVDNYPIMHLIVNPLNYKITSQLAPNALGQKAYLQTPAKSPWRTIFITNKATEILQSNMVLNLNEPCKLENTDWIKPMKYVGIWWEMHVGLSTWDYAGSQNAQNALSGDLLPSGRHGATTQNTIKYIDFAAKHGFDAVLIEGWNVGWEDWFGNWKENVFDFTTPYPDFDIEKITKYAEDKGIKLIMHHETSGSASNYERHLDRAFDHMIKYSYPAVKTGYVGRIIPRGEFHDGQIMVNHFHHIVKRAADYKIMVNSHESSRPTGMHRTYPNYIAAEAARGNEFNAWSNGNPPAHETILPFTRLLGGPMDYTPGIFETKMSLYDSSKTFHVKTTLAKQLALYVILYSPLQMAADLPENYEKYSDVFQFIKDVALDWQKTIYLDAEPGDFIIVARKEKNSENWFVGAITDENARNKTIKLDFLNPDKSYIATIYKDGKNADWKNNPKDYQIVKMKVNSKTSLDLIMAASGGIAISIVPEKI